MWICPVCGKANRDDLLCERCGFDESLHYKKYRTLKAVEGSREDLYGPRGNISAAFQGEPFDVFLCCQEADESGERTPDSILAEELYRQLTKEGFRVFLPRITLEGISGVSYISGLSAALESAGAMVVLGTKPEYFRGAYVRNQWSRYLDLVKKDGGKLLIPTYRDMSPEDLPEELSCLQALDMSGFGFLLDVIRKIRKVSAAEATGKAHPASEENLSESGEAPGAEVPAGKPAEKPEAVQENRPEEIQEEKSEETKEEKRQPVGKKQTRWIALAALAVIICSVAVSIFMSQKNRDVFSYTVLEDGTIEITGYEGEGNEELLIPNSIDGRPVTKIGSAAFLDCDLSGRLTLPEGLLEIGDHAFAGCNGLSGKLTLPEGLLEIGDSAFECCNGLSGSLTLPEGLTKIGNLAFRECSGLSGSLTLPEGLTEIGISAFYGCSGLSGSLTLPEGLTKIGNTAFMGCSGLSGSLMLPESLTEIGFGAFAGCDGLDIVQ